MVAIIENKYFNFLNINCSVSFKFIKLIFICRKVNHFIVNTMICNLFKSDNT